MSRSAIALIFPSSIWTSYVCPVRLSVIVSVSVAVATAPPSVARSSVPMGLPVVSSPPLWRGSAAGTPAGSAGHDGHGHRRHHEQGAHAHDGTPHALLGGEALVADPEGRDDQRPDHQQDARDIKGRLGGLLGLLLREYQHRVQHGRRDYPISWRGAAGGAP